MTIRPLLRRWIGPLSAAGLLAVGWLAVALLEPPTPPRGEGAETEFSVARAWRHIEEVARAAHPVGTVEHDRVRAYVVGELVDLGLEVDTLTALSHGGRGGTVVSALTRNVAARMPGTASTGAVLLVSHYDAVPLAPGAGDAAIGVATVLETARALRAGQAPRNDVVFLLTDAEELGLLGARAFAAEHAWMDEIAFVLNFEGRGTSGPAVMFETGPGSGWAVRELGRRGIRPVSSSIMPEAYSRMPNDTDFTVFRALGLPGLNFAIGGSAQWYHTPGDRPENLSRASVRQMGDNALAMARQVGSMDLGTVEASERIFFHVPGLGLLGYGPGWAIPLAALLVMALIAVAVFARRRGRLSWWSIPVGLLAAGLTLVVSILLAHWLWVLVRDGHAEWGAIVGRALHREWPYTLAVMALTLATITATFGLLRRWFGLEGLALGALLLPVAIAVASALMFPAGSYLFLWPSLLALGSVALVAAGVDADDAGGDADDAGGDADDAGGDAWRRAGIAGAAAGIVLFMAPVVYLVHVMLSIAVAPLLAAVAGLLVLLLLPMLDMLAPPHRAWLPGAALLATGALVAYGASGIGPTTDRPAPSNLVHIQDAQTASAFWAAPAGHDDPFIARYLGTSSDTVRLGEYSGWLRSGRYRAARAPLWAAPPVTVAIADDVVAGGVRTVRIRLAWEDPPMAAEIRPSVAGIRLLSPLPAARLTAGGATAMAEGWRLVRAGLGQPLELVIAGPADVPLGLTLTTHFQGLPSAEGGVADRPPGLMATPAHGRAGTLSDVRLVREQLAF